MQSHSLSWKHEYIEANNVRLHYVVQGEGELVVLVHGFLEFWYSWRHQIPALARHFKVVVPDLRGYNDSDKPIDGYDLDTVSRDICELIHHLGYLKAHIVGHDWGGTIAWHLAQRFPQYLDRLAILNAAHPQRFRQELFSNLEQMGKSWPLFVAQIPNLSEWLVQQNLGGFVTNFFQGQAVRKGAFSQQDTNLYRDALQKPGVIKAAMNYYRQFLSLPDWIGQWARGLEPIVNPTLVLWGEEDALLCPSLNTNLEALVAGPLQIKHIPQCGHWIQQEAPLTVNRELLRFLSKS